MKPTQPTTTTHIPASREALHALGNGIDPIRWQLADLLRDTRRADIPASVLEHLGKAQAELNAAFNGLVDAYHKEARND